MKSSIRNVGDIQWTVMDAVIHLFAAVLVPLFFLGLIGSLLVVVLTIVRDLQEVFTSDEFTE